MKVRVVFRWYYLPNDRHKVGFEKVCDLARLPAQGEAIGYGKVILGYVDRVVHESAADQQAYVMTADCTTDGDPPAKETYLAAGFTEFPAWVAHQVGG